MTWTCSNCGEVFLVPAFAHVPSCIECGGVLCGKCYCVECKKNERERATELEFFKWMFVNLNLGAAHSTVMDMMKECFMDATGKNIPEGWNRGQSGETSLDRKE